MLTVLIFVLLLITVNTHYIHGYPVYEDGRLTSNNQTKEESLKEWKVYIDEYLELLIQLLLSPDTNIQTFLFLQQNYVTYFAEKSKTVIPLYFYTFGSKIKIASGKMFLYSRRNKLWNHFKPDIYGRFYQFAATFKMDKRLSLNLTLHDLYFSSGCIDCKRGNMSVFEFKSKKIERLILLYCGYHSEFSIYPGESSFSILTSVYAHTLMVLNATFSVTDLSLVKTFPTKYYSQTNSIFIWNVYENYAEISLLVQTWKTHKITLQLSQKYLQWHVVYNGPGHMSAILNQNKVYNNKVYIYNCSSFQCLVNIIPSDSKNTFVNYSSMQLATLLKKEIHNTSYMTLFGNSNCSVRPCLIILHAQSDFQVNVTVMAMSYKSTKSHSQDCRYGGLVFTEDLKGNEKEIGPFCQNHSYLTEVSRSYYSSNSTLIMVFYSYDEYSTINVTLKLTQTKCKPVALSYYDVQLFCQYKESHNHCAKYLQQITQGTAVSLSLSSSENFEILFSLSSPGCVVVHIIQEIIHSYKLLMERQKKYGILTETDLFLTTEPISNFGLKLDYKIIGILTRSIFTEYYPEAVTFVSIDETEQFCFRALQNNSLVCKKPVKRLTCEQSFGCETIDNKIKTSRFNDIPIVGWVTTKTPLTLQKFRMKFRFYKHSESWVDVLISKTKIDQRNQKCDMECQFLSETLPLVPKKMSFKVNRLFSQDDSILLLTLNAVETDIIKLKSHSFQVDIKTGFDLKYEVFLLLMYPMSFWELVPGKVISLPDKMDAIIITLNQPVNDDISEKLNIMWIHENYIKYVKNSNPLWSEARRCYTNVDRYALGYKSCLNVSFINYSHYFILYSKEFGYSGFDRLQNPSGYTSWIEASELCRDVGGYLPYFTSREKLDELLVLLKLSPDIYPIEALYIGLTSNPVVL